MSTAIEPTIVDFVPGQTMPERFVLIVVDPNSYGHMESHSAGRTYWTDESGLVDRIELAKSFARENEISRVFIERKH